ncbi:hypothetical protein MBLNU13_g09272t2 [Cladosporium sp. NU13]
MPRRGSGHASGSQRRPSNQRPPPQAYHEDTYLRSFGYELSDDEISRMRANRHFRIPGLTPHHDPPRHMPSSSSQSSGSSTVLGNARSDGGHDTLDEPISQRRAHAAISELDTDGRHPSWPYRRPAEPDMFTPASFSVYSYPADIDIPSESVGTHDRRGRVDRLVASERGPVTSVRPLEPRPEVPRPPLEHYRIQGNNVRTDLQRQRPKRRLPAHSGPSTINDDRNKHPKYDD